MTSRLIFRAVLAVLLGTLLWAPSSAAQEAQHFLMVNPGNEAATPDRAEDFLSRMGRYLHDTVPALQDRPVRGWITNRRDSAQTYLARDPVLAFVPPSVYLEVLHGPERAATPVAEIPRFDAAAQRYHLVAPNDGPSSLDDLRGGLVRASAGTDRTYLSRVVFPSSFQPGPDVNLETTENMNDEVFLMTEGPMGDEQPADALLLDADLKHFFKTDDLVWPQLTVIWSSEPLPRDLVVALGPSWTDSDRTALQEALFQMPDHELGSELLDLMNSSGFVPVTDERLSEVARQYSSQ
jgi:hypothetical protein